MGGAMERSESGTVEVKDKTTSKMLTNTVSHPHIVAAPRCRCIKGAPEMGRYKSGRWTVKSMAAQGCQDDGNAMSNEQIINSSVDNCSPCNFRTSSLRVLL